MVVVGGGLASVRLCATLRRKKFAGRLTVVRAEQEVPYDRPPLSKSVLMGDRDESPLPFDAERLDVDLRLGIRATDLSTDRRVLVTEAGEIAYDALAIATGASPVRLPGNGPQVTLRTLDEARHLREALSPGQRIVIIGASWIGAEVATAARARGCTVTCLELGPEPLSGALGTAAGAATRPWWSQVDLRTGVTVTAVEQDGVRLSTGETIPADLVVTGIGVRPDISWLEGSGVRTDRGVLTDTRCRTNVDGIVALGDVAQRWTDHTGEHRCAEHWDEANTVAGVATQTLLGILDGKEHDPVPYFWSDQFGRKLQYVGAHAPTDTLDLEVGDDGTLVRARWSTEDGSLTAWLGVDLPTDVVKARAAVGGPVSALD